MRNFETEEVKSVNTKPHFGPEENEEVAIHIKLKK